MSQLSVLKSQFKPVSKCPKLRIRQYQKANFDSRYSNLDGFEEVKVAVRPLGIARNYEYKQQDDYEFFPVFISKLLAWHR